MAPRRWSSASTAVIRLLVVSDKDIPSSVAGDEEAMVAQLLRAGCQFPCLRLCLEIEAFS